MDDLVDVDAVTGRIANFLPHYPLDISAREALAKRAMSTARGVAEVEKFMTDVVGVEKSQFYLRFVTDEADAAKHAFERGQAAPPTKAVVTSKAELISEISALAQNNIISGLVEPESKVFAHALRFTFFGLPRVFSRTPLAELCRISLSKMLVHKTHKGNYLLCRVITKPAAIVKIVTSTVLGIEDPEGFVERLSIMYYPTLAQASSDYLADLFPVGTILAIREPTYVSTLNGKCTIRIDSPSDVLPVDRNDKLLSDVHWSSELDQPDLPTTADEWKQRGTVQFKRSRWLTAAICFTEGLKVDPGSHVLLLNRAEVYLRLAWFRSALLDAQAVLDSKNVQDDSLVRKATYRAARAHYGLGQYARAAEVAESRSDDPTCAQYSSRAKQRMHEQEKGEYDWKALFKESQRRNASPDVAEFYGPVAAKERTDAGGSRGVFATRNIKIGELLMVCRPLSSGSDKECHPDRSEVMAYNLDTRANVPIGRFPLMERLLVRLYDDPDFEATLNGLYAGPKYPSPSALPSPESKYISPLVPRAHPLIPAVDIDVGRHLEAITTFNGFGFDGTTSSVTVDNAARRTGIYSFASLHNHSCLPNTFHEFFGDVLVIRAQRNIAAGTEITVNYLDPDRPYSEREMLFRQVWGFRCDCPLCRAERADGTDACLERDNLYHTLKGTQPQDERLSGLVKRLEKTYGDHAEWRACGTRKVYLLHAYLLQSTQRIIRASFADADAAIEFLIKAIEFTGLVVLDRSFSGPLKRKTPLIVDATRGPQFKIVECELHVLTIAHSFQNRRDHARMHAWLKVLLWLNDIQFGGGKAMLKLRYRYCYKDNPDFIEFLDDALKW